MWSRRLHLRMNGLNLSSVNTIQRQEALRLQISLHRKSHGAAFENHGQTQTTYNISRKLLFLNAFHSQKRLKRKINVQTGSRKET
jgi:hypothetical protein